MLIVDVYRDVINFFRFRREMRKEEHMRDSKFNKLGLKLNDIGSIVYYQLDCTDEDLMNFNYNEEAMVGKKIEPQVMYLSYEMNWGEYITTRIENFVDTEGTPSLSYGILFVYTTRRLTLGGAISVVVGIGLAVVAALVALAVILL